MTNSKTFPSCYGDKTIEMINDPLYGEIPRTIYKYRDWGNDWHKRFIFNQEVYYAPPKEFNDPFDCGIPIAWHMLKLDPELCRNYFHDFTRRSMMDEPERIQREEAEKLIAEGRYNNDNWINYCNQRSLEKLNNEYGVFSATGVRDNILMWAHYANTHKGFCIGYNTASFAREIGGMAGPTIYEPQYPDISPVESFPKSIIRQLMTKAQFWDYEVEYRLIQSGLKDRAIKISKEIITEIIFGYKTPKEHMAEITEYVKAELPHVTLLKAVPKDRTFALDIHPV